MTMHSLLAPTLALVTALPVVAIADEAYQRSPGYVDFGDLKSFANGEESVEVFLAPPLLGLIEAIIQREEPSLAAMIDELLLVKVDVFSFDSDRAGDLEAVADRVAKDLGEKGWQRLVKVQQRDERILLYVLPTTEEREGRDHQLISGVVVVVLGADALSGEIAEALEDDPDRDRRRRRRNEKPNEAVFVNIVGSFDLLAIAELIDRFDVPHVRDHLDDLEEWKEDTRRDEGR